MPKSIHPVSKYPVFIEQIFWYDCIMDVIYLLLERLGLRPQGSLRQYQMEEQVQALIGDLARQEQLTEWDVTTGLLASALADRQVSQEMVQHWQSLSRRQQQVAALTCLGYTNRQIAARLGLAPSTIKTHIKSIMYKFNLRSKMELVLALRAWDFSEWDHPPAHGGEK